MNLPTSFEYSRPIEVAGQGSSIPKLVVEGSDFRRSGLRAANVLCPPGRRQETPPTESFTLYRPPTTDHRPPTTDLCPSNPRIPKASTMSRPSKSPPPCFVTTKGVSW